MVSFRPHLAPVICGARLSSAAALGTAIASVNSEVLCHVAPVAAEDSRAPGTSGKTTHRAVPLFSPFSPVRIFAALFVFFLTIGVKLSAAEIPPVISAWLNAQTNIQTWTADVTQIRTLKTLTQPLTSTGHVWFAAPNQFRWEIGNPAQTIAVRKSDEMLVIYPRLKRAERYSFTIQSSGPWKDTLALLEAGFPRNEADLSRQFKISSVNTSNQICRLQLEPKSASARHMMPHLSISFSTNDFVLRATELQFADGSTMRNEFSNPALNPKIDPPLFAPQLGPDYKIVEPMKH